VAELNPQQTKGVIMERHKLMGKLKKLGLFGIFMAIVREAIERWNNPKI